MLSTFSRRTTILRPSYGIANFFSGAKAAEVPPTSSRPASVASAAVNAKTSTAAAKPVDKVIVARKSNINQSPLKIKFLVSLIRDAWMPDALAQMKFSPKPRAQDVAKILKRACALAMQNYNAVPEELHVSEVIVNKGTLRKKVRIMGRGRSGVSRIRSAHVTVKVSVIDFAKRIAEAETLNQKLKWKKIQTLALVKKEAKGPTTLTASAAN